LEHRGIAQPGSAAVLGTAGRWFESSCPDQNIILSQILSCCSVDICFCYSIKIDTE
jgi:hypothetical protein